MCGIAGFRSEHQASIDGMTDSLKHRGPDGRGVFSRPPVSLGHTRLSIIDLATGSQPMTSADGRHVVIFNGEIYNYRELRSSLKARGYQFRTRSDTEVLLGLYAHHGTDLLSHVNGMFAFCIYDKEEDLLFGARDRLGIKPFYYTRGSRGFFFGSEIKAILASGAVEQKPDPVALNHYFTFRYIPGERTAFAGIRKLPPAHAFTLDAGYRFRRWRYWDLPEEKAPVNLEEALEEFDHLLTDAVRLRLISDVPLGAFLSGGMDSTTIVGIMKKLGHSPIRTYTVGFGLDIDETEDAEVSARHFGCEHRSFEMPADAFDMAGEAVYQMDEPYGDAIILAYLLLSAEAARDVKVILTGEGADEGQMGYFHHESLFFGLGLGRRLPAAMLSLAASLVRRLPLSLLNRGFNYPHSMGPAGRERFADLLPRLKSPGQAYFSMISLFSEDDRKELFGPALAGGAAEAREEIRAWSRALDSAADPLRGYYRFELAHWLPDNILNKQDRMTMARGIEGRVPFLDHRLVEFLASLPLDLKIRKGRGKYLLQELYNSSYRPSRRGRAEKKPFFMPMEGKFRPAFEQFMERHLGEEALRESDYIQAPTVGKIRRLTRESPLLYDKQLMAVAMFNAWREQFDI